MREEKGYGDYGAMANHYDAGRVQFPEWIFSELHARVNTYDLPPEQLTVLDVGCGTGVGTRQLYDAGFTRVMGADLDQRMLVRTRKIRTSFYDYRYSDKSSVTNAAERKALRAHNAAAHHRNVAHSRIVYLVSPASKLPFLQNTFKIVTSFGSLSWFSHDEASMRRLKHVLKYKGLLMAADEDCLFDSEELESIKARFAPNRPRRAPVLHPVKALGCYNFQNIEHLERQCEVDLSVFQASSYVLAGSWVNFVPRKQRWRAEREIHAFCSRLDQNYRVRWKFNFSVTFARKEVLRKHE